MSDADRARAHNRQILLARRPGGVPLPDDFSMIVAPLPELPDGKMLVRHLYIGLSPSARLRMAGDSSYGAGMPLGRPVQGQAVGIVTASRNPAFQAGDHVVVNGGWQDYSITSGLTALRVDPGLAPVSAALGLLGTSGMTAFVGLRDIGKPNAGETLVVSAASGSVGSVVGQIGRIMGCRVVGIAGGPEKCAYVTNDLGFDACADHRRPDFAEQLAAACPDGIDVSFENVGGALRDAVMPLMNDFGRIVLCGMIAEYGTAQGLPGPSWFPILTRRLTIRGFLLRDHESRRAEFMTQMAEWHRTGQVRFREDVTRGLENAPAGFIRLLRGDNFGKALVEVGHD